jgi:hypothetical protein
VGIAIVTQMGKLGARRKQRWIALACLFLAMALSTLEATHVHSSADLVGNSSARCEICAAAHANSPVIAFHPLPVLLPVEIIHVSGPREEKRAANKLKLFIRPPPSA